MCFNPGNVTRRRVLLDLNRLERRHRLHHFEIVAQDVLVDVQSFGEWFDKRVEILTLYVFAREDHVVDRTRINDHAAFAIKDHAARRRDWQTAATLVYSDFGVAVASDHLQDVEPHTEQAEHDDDQHLDKPEACSEILRCIFKFHGFCA